MAASLSPETAAPDHNDSASYHVDFTPNPALYPFESQWFESSVGRIHYLDEGERRPLLLMHGNPDWSFLYREMIPLLSEHFRCIAVDYPGFGLSVHPAGYSYLPSAQAEVVAELVEYLDLEDAVLVGQDWGKGHAIFPKAIVGETEWLTALEQRVRANLSHLPMLRIMGMKDVPLTTKAYLRKWDELWPDATKLDLPNAGHFWQEDEPEAAAGAIIRAYAR